MHLLVLFDIFLLAVCYYSMSNFSSAARLLVPLACLFCMFWIQKLDKQIREDKERQKRLLRSKLEKHHAAMQTETREDEETEESLLRSKLEKDHAEMPDEQESAATLVTQCFSSS